MYQDNKIHWQRTHYCGELRLELCGQEVILCGWANRQRDMGNLIFIDVRDRTGIAQIVVSSEQIALLGQDKAVKMEYVLGIRGIVRDRGEKMRNPSIPSGDIEIEVTDIEVLSTSEIPPFMIADPPQASEELRFKYRYLDLRRPAMQRNLLLRHQAALKVRNFLSSNGFLEIETPFMTKSTPEGARDYLVPSRVYKGRFFALPQSPQLFKQLLMISGFDRYFQIVRCFRDEDLRADRQPEFTQIDVEMSFCDRDGLFSLCETMLAELFALIDVTIDRPFPRFSYVEAMEKYGSDKPDLRFGMELQDLTETGHKIDSNIIKSALDAGCELKALVVEKAGDLSRGRLDKLNQRARDLGGKGLIWIKKPDGFKSSLKLAVQDFELLWQAGGAGEDDLMLLVADKKLAALHILGEIRLDFKPEALSDLYKFAWVTDFPLFEWSEEEGRLVSMHHPFTSPLTEDMPLLETEPDKIRAQAYDVVLNGVEIGGGSIRINNPELQHRIFTVLGLSEQEAQEKFGFFLNALRYGAPPHGGIAFGFDRIIMLLAGEESIREIIPFPKTTSSLCLLTGSPTAISERQLRELGLTTTKK